MGFLEIGFVIRLIFVYGLNAKKQNQAYKGFEERETMKDFWTGLIFVAVVVIVGFIVSFV